MHVASVDHIHIYSVDPGASIDFWTRHFSGERVLTTKNAHDQDVHLVRVGGQVLAFSEFPPGLAGAAPPASATAGREGMAAAAGVMHLGVHVDRVAAAAEELRRGGVLVYTEPAEAHGVTFAYVQAPDGVLIELTEYEAG